MSSHVFETQHAIIAVVTVFLSVLAVSGNDKQPLPCIPTTCEIIAWRGIYRSCLCLSYATGSSLLEMLQSLCSSWSYECVNTSFCHNLRVQVFLDYLKPFIRLFEAFSFIICYALACFSSTLFEFMVIWFLL